MVAELKPRTRQLTIPEINAELIRLARLREEVADAFEQTAIDAANLRSDYDTAKAEAMIVSKGDTAKDREAAATLKCSNEMRAARRAEAARDGLKARCSAISDIINAIQSVGTNTRVEYDQGDKYRG